VRRGGGKWIAALLRGDEADDEALLLRHAGIMPLACTDRQRARMIVPHDRDARIVALLVAVRHAIIIVEREAAIRAAIDEQGDRRALRRARPFNRLADRHDRARAHEQGHPLGRRLRLDRPTALHEMAGVEIIPAGGGQIDAAAARLEGGRWLRGALVAAVLAVPDRDERLP